MTKRAVIAISLMLILACGSPAPRVLHLYPTDTPVPLPSPTVTQEATMVVRTDVPEQIGIVVVEVLERRVGPGESYAAYIVPLKRGDRVRILECVDVEGNTWAKLDEHVWAAAVYEGKTLMEGCE